MASPCLCKPPMASGPASHVKPVTKQTFGRASPGTAREAAPEALPNGALDVQRPGAGKLLPFRGPRVARVAKAGGWLARPGSAGVSHRGIFPNGELYSLFKSTTSHAWSHKRNATRPSPTESSGDLEKDAVFVSECSCRAVCTRIVV